MGVQGLQDYIEAHCQRACVSVELQRIARGRVGKRPPNAPLCLVVDAENCLHRLYGGSFRDWVCGGQWNEMLAFIGALTRACHAANIELVVCFNGAVEKPRLPEWIKRQNNNRQTAYQIFCHLHNKATPPPKVWFTPPVSLASCIRLALRHYGVRCYQSLTDHHHEVMAFCRQHEFHGVVARDSDYAVFDPPRYFSSEKLKLSRNGRSLTTVQYLMDEVGKELGLTPEKLVVFAALLGNHILPDEDLASFHWALLGPTHPLAGLKVRAHQLVLPPCDVVIKAVAEYVKNLPSVDDLDKVAQDVFQHSETRKDDKMKKFKESVMYYRAGTKDGNWPILQAVDPQPSSNQEPDADTDHTPQQQPQECAGARDATMPEIVVSEVMESAQQGNPQIVVSKELDTVNEDLQNALRSEIEAQLEDDLDRKMQNMTLETIEDSSSETSTLDSSQELTNIATASEENKAAGDMSPSERFSPKVAWEKITREEEEREREEALRRGGDPAAEDSKGGPPMVTRMASPASQASTSDTTSTTSSSANPTPETKDPTAGIPSLMSTPVRPYLDVTIPKLPTISPSVLRTAQYRHKLGLMNPWIYQIITQGEIKIDLTLEDEAMKDLPSAAELWRPARQLTYGILFNVAHQGKKKKGKEQAPRRQVIVKEWCVQKGRSIQKPELVEALPLDWKVSRGPYVFRTDVPKVKQLWFGQEVEDKNRRLRAFLSCMLADTPAMLKPLYVPHHLLVLCCVLRYMLQWPGRPLLRRHELDAFLAQSVDPRLANPQALEAMQVPMVTTRGVQIAALFMRGVETAMFANEACGAPVVWELTCPWLFFDGKLFHTKLLKSSANKPLRELCDGQMDQVAKVERMRQSILEGLTNDWARMPLPRMGPMGMGGYGGLLPPPNLRPAGLGPLPGRGRGLAGKVNNLGKPVSGRGGKLQIAGIPVGEWAGNPSGVGNYQPPQVTSVGGYRKGVSYQIPPRGRGMARGGMAMRGRGAMHPMYHGARSAAAWGIQDPGMYYDYSQATPYYMGTYPLPGQQYRNKKNKKNKKGNNKGGKAQEQGQGQGPGGVGEAGDATSQLAGITLALRNKVQSKGRGRGCTVETGDAEVGGGAIPVSQLGSGEGKDVATEEEDVEQTANGDLMELDSAPVEVADGDVEVSSSEESEDEDDLVATVTTTVLEEAAEVSSTGQEGEVPDVTIAELETDAPTLGKGSLLEEEEHDLSTDSGELQNGSVMSPDSGLGDHSTPEKPSSLTDTATSQEVQG